MQRKTGSLMELFTCRNCKKRRHFRQSKDSRNAPQPRPSRDSNENASVAVTTPEAPSAAEEADDEERRQTTTRERARTAKDLESSSSKSIFYDDDDDPVVLPRHQVATAVGATDVELSTESPQSILKNPESPLNAEKSRHPGVSASEKRRARFKEAVDVIIHDNHGNAVVMDRVKLKSPADDNCCSVGLSGPGPLGPTMGPTMGPALSPVDDRVALGAVSRRRSSSVFSLRSMRVERDGSGRRYLRLVVSLGEAFTERTIHVCTARGGSRILVGAYKPEPLGDGTNYLRQYIDRFHLPHPVDALSIRGELDRSGELVITAPLFDFDGETTVDASGRPNPSPNKRTSSL